jgi:hypothetical protein
VSDKDRISGQFVCILVAFAGYAAALIWRSSFVVEGTRYFCLLDDPMISMRYAANLAHGYGLVWNPGSAPVEGYTNLLWTLYMGVLHLLPIAPSKISLAVQITGLILLLVNLVFVRKIALLVAFGSETVSLAAVALTAFYFPLDNWALRGSEVAVLTPISSAAVWMTLLYLLRGRGKLLPLYLLLGVSTLVRFDMAVFAGAVILWVAFMEQAPLDVRIRHLFLGGLVLILFLGAQIAFQIYYYGQPMPNTYYLKLTGFPLAPRLVRGFLVAAAFFGESAALLLVIFYSGVLKRFSSSISFLVFLFAIQVSYSIYVGGDAWESWFGSNRYISIVMPLVMVIAAYALELLLRRRAIAATAGHQLPAPQYRNRSVLVKVLLLVLAVNAGRFSNFLLLSAPPETQENRTLVQQALLVRQVTLPTAKIAVVWAGAVVYFADRPAIDLLGKNDFIIAHEPMHLPPGLERWYTFHPGHMKWDYSYSIGQLKPDLVLHLGQSSALQPDLARDYGPMRFPGYGLDYYAYARRGSPNVLWDRVAALEKVQNAP